MNNSLPIAIAFSLAFAATASAQEKAELVQTSGYGELRRASEALIAPKQPNISVRIPVMVTKGEIISLQYEGEGAASVADSFMVTGVTIMNGTCSIESKRETPTGSSLSDMIYAGSCKKLK